jgi:hypothetical protein
MTPLVLGFSILFIARESLFNFKSPQTPEALTGTYTEV